MKKLIFIAVFTALSGVANADFIDDEMVKCVSQYIAHAITPDYAARACAAEFGGLVHPYTDRGTLITEDGTIVDAVNMKPLMWLGKASERIRLLQQRNAQLRQQAAEQQLQGGTSYIETLNAAHDTEQLMIRLAQCGGGRFPTWRLPDSYCRAL